MSNFAKLIPAFACQICLDAPIAIGAVSQGNSMTHVGFIPNKGFIRSEPDYPIKVDAVFIHGSDYIRADPSGKFVRLEVSSLLKDKTGAPIRYDYTGTINIAGPAGKVLAGHADAATTNFGDAFIHVKFETGSEELKAIERKVYVGTGRFIVEAGQPLIVEYKISEIVQ